MAIDDKGLFRPTNMQDALKSSRDRLGLTHEQLSKLTKEIDPKKEGVSRVALSRYETGAALPGLRELRLIALALRTPLSLFAYGEKTDPMLRYKLSLEMRIMDMVMGEVTAEGVIKQEDDNDPVTPEFLALVEQVKKPK